MRTKRRQLGLVRSVGWRHFERKDSDGDRVEGYIVDLKCSDGAVLIGEIPSETVSEELADVLGSFLGVPVRKSGARG